MPNPCCVPGCRNRKGFRFPHEDRDADRRHQWIQAVNRRTPEGGLWLPALHSAVCADHFRTEDFVSRGSIRRVLRPDAVPSIFTQETMTSSEYVTNSWDTDCDLPSDAFMDIDVTPEKRNCVIDVTSLFKMKKAKTSEDIVEVRPKNDSTELCMEVDGGDDNEGDDEEESDEVANEYSTDVMSALACEVPDKPLSRTPDGSPSAAPVNPLSCAPDETPFGAPPDSPSTNNTGEIINGHLIKTEPQDFLEIKREPIDYLENNVDGVMDMEMLVKSEPYDPNYEQTTVEFPPNLKTENGDCGRNMNESVYSKCLEKTEVKIYSIAKGSNARKARSIMISKPYKCYHCDKIFDDYVKLVIHLQYHEKRNICEKCGHCFDKKGSAANKHECSKTVGKKTYRCIQCDKSFPELSQVKAHIKTHAKVEKPYSCSQCEKHFKNIKKLKAHELEHVKPREFPCKYCGKCFSSSYTMTTHLEHHDEEIDCSCRHCEKCDKFFKSRAALNKHLRTHTDERNFLCDKCGKEFKQISVLNKHALIHKDFPPFACNDCDKRFNSKSNLEVHRRVHTGEKPYKCEHCDKRFSVSWNMTTHMKTSCVKMGKRIPNKTVLQ